MRRAVDEASARCPYAEGMPGPSHSTPPVPALDHPDRWPPWPPRAAWRGHRGPPRLLLAVALGVFQVLGTMGAAQGQPERRPLDAFALVLLLAGPVAIAFLMSRVGVVPATVVVGAVTAVYLVLGYPYGPVVVSLVVVLVVSVVTGHRVAAWLVAAGVLAAHSAAVVLDPARPWSWVGATATLAWTLLMLALAEVVRVRRERALTHRRALREERRRQAGEERLRIAQDLHDVVAHHMSLIHVQASVALHLRERQPEQVDEALRVIKGASKEALVELRSLIDVLRDGEGPAPRRPAASLAALDDLVERSRYAGLDVTSHVTGVPAPLPSSVEVAAYRVVQEAVTNVVRHAGATRAEITVEHTPGRLAVRVDDDGSGQPGVRGAEEGHGIRGMRERATALGGRLEVTPSPLGGLRVSATFPTGEAP